MWPELTSMSWRPGLTSVWRLCSIRPDIEELPNEA